MPADVRLTAPQVRALVAARSTIEDHHALLDRAERAGYNVTEWRDHLNMWDQRRQGMLAEFAPKPLRSE